MTAECIADAKGPRRLRKLKEQHAIREKFNFRDARQVLYQIMPREGAQQEATA
jgi:hypothetical protein